MQTPQSAKPQSITAKSTTRQLQQDIINTVNFALKEDLHDGTDITAELISANNIANATIITREACIICGVEWVNEVFKQLDATVSASILADTNANKETETETKSEFIPTTITWFVSDGQHVSANTTLFELTGYARTLLTGERTALNFLQTLSGTATITSEYVKALKIPPPNY